MFIQILQTLWGGVGGGISQFLRGECADFQKFQKPPPQVMISEWSLILYK